MQKKLENVLTFLNNLHMGSYPGLDKHLAAINDVNYIVQHSAKLHETIADIAYMAGVDRYYSGDSRLDMQKFIHLADKFEQEHEGVDWNAEAGEDAPDYITSVEDFYKENVVTVPKMVFDYPCGAKDEWDNIEIAGCKIEDDGKGVYRLDDDDKETPDFWTVYLHRAEGGTMAVADMPTEKEANDIAELIHNAAITFKDNGYIALYRNGEAHRRFNLFIDERIKMASSPQTMAAYEVVKEQFNKLIKD